tara:strand:+ start:994 stop:1212 length:219 start_codon:yes stop_codon:yes gene_type:complete
MDGEIKMTAANNAIEILKRVDIDHGTIEYILKELNMLKNEVYLTNGKYFRNQEDALKEGKKTNYGILTYNLH